jgi:hypothetical protein
VSSDSRQQDTSNPSALPESFIMVLFRGFGLIGVFATVDVLQFDARSS